MLLLLGGVSKALQACGWAGAAGSVSFCWALVGRGHDCSRGHSWCVTVEKGMGSCGGCWNPERCCNSRRKQILMIRRSGDAFVVRV